VKIGRAYEVLLTQGIPEFVQQIRASAAISGRVEALFDELKAYKPKTVSDVSTLISAYSNAIDVLSISVYANNLLEAASNATDIQDAANLAVVGAVFYEMAGTVIDGTKDIFEVGKGAGGVKLQKSVKAGQVADFFRKAAQANLAAFNSLILNPAAEQYGVSESAVQQEFAGTDFDYGLAQSSLGVIQGGLDEYLGNADTAAYAKLGGAVELYARTSGLLSKYYSLAEVNPDLEVVGIANDQALTSALDLGRDQVQRAVAVLKSEKVSPTLVVGSYEIAGVSREGEASDKLDALSQYLSAYVGSRVLAYLGGFQAEGMK
jgi:hypothetical protein